MTAVPFDCSPMATFEPASAAPSWPMKATSATRRTRIEARRRASLLHAADERAEHLRVRQVVDRRRKDVAEGRPDGDHHLVLGGARLCRADLFDSGRVRDEPIQVARVDCIGQRLEQLPAVALEPVARAGAGVGVRVVDGRVHRPALVDDRRRLEIVRAHPLPLHADDRRRDVLEAAFVERPRDVEAGDRVVEYAIGGEHVCGAVAVGQVAARVAVRGGLDLGLRDRREAEAFEDSLDRTRAPLTNAQRPRARVRARCPRPPASRAAPSATRPGRRRRSSRRRTCCPRAASRSSPT